MKSLLLAFIIGMSLSSNAQMVKILHGTDGINWYQWHTMDLKIQMTDTLFTLYNEREIIYNGKIEYFGQNEAGADWYDMEPKRIELYLEDDTYHIENIYKYLIYNTKEDLYILKSDEDMILLEIQK
jgi:hypothetical protein